jgi:hypothetical protein
VHVEASNYCLNLRALRRQAARTTSGAWRLIEDAASGRSRERVRLRFASPGRGGSRPIRAAVRERRGVSVVTLLRRGRPCLRGGVEQSGVVRVGGVAVRRGRTARSCSPRPSPRRIGSRSLPSGVFVPPARPHGRSLRAGLQSSQPSDVGSERRSPSASGPGPVPGAAATDDHHLFDGGPKLLTVTVTSRTSGRSVTRFPWLNGRWVRT